MPLSSLDLAALARCPLLRDAPENTMAELRHRASARVFAPGGVVFEQDSLGDSIFVLLPQRAALPGLVALRATDPDGGQPVLAGLVRESEAFGEIEPLRRLAGVAPHGRALEAYALTSVRVVEISWSLLQSLIARDPALQVRLAGVLADRVSGLATALRATTVDALEVRLARLLLALLPLLGPRGDSRAGQATTQSDLAALVGARREAVSLKLSHWRRAGILGAGTGRRVVVLSTARGFRVWRAGRTWRRSYRAHARPRQSGSQPGARSTAPGARHSTISRPS